jgi:two-component system C4-dicarboxylate transport sensor histidine kinase DctB
MQYIKNGNTEKAQEKVDKILEGTRRINRLIERLRDYSGNTELGCVACLLRDIISDAAELISHRFKKSRVALSYDSVPVDLKVYCDFQKMSQVLVNLIGNAIDAIGEKEGTIEIRAMENDESVTITVADSGPGISQDDVESVFEPFITSKSKDHGTGLGLFITRHLVEEHDGRIAISRNDASGAEFRITLPRRP